MDDVRKIIYGVVIAFGLMMAVWFGLIYVSSCGLTLTCQRASPRIDRTPIPTIIPATMPAPDHSRRTEFNKCQIATGDLIGAWVTAGHPENGTFAFTDANGASCAGNFEEDVQPLFVNSNLWYAGALACSSCHNPSLLTTNAGLDLTSYEGMTMGSRREDETAQGNDIFGDGAWEESILYDWLFLRKHIPLARPPELAAEGPVIYAGSRLSGPAPADSATPTATP
jgi:hypothetical protein